MPTRRHRGTIAWLWGACFVLLVALHEPYLKLAYYWDELGQFIPQALDLYEEGRWIPVHTMPNVHPPGVIAWLALVWKLLGGHSILATRVAMLAIAAFAVVGTFRLAIRLSQRTPGAPAFSALLLLLSAPLFYTQAMMAQTDMPAMAFTVWALLLFLDRRWWPSALLATAAVLMKETAVVFPVLAVGWLIVQEKRGREAVYFLLPFAALAAWIAYLWHGTGHPFGDPEFGRYNAWYSLHPVRFGVALLRRVFYLFFAEFRWIGTIGIALAWRKTAWLRSPEWKFAGAFALLYAAAVSAFGGAVLERYLLPVMPILFAAMGIGWMALPGRLRLILPGAAVIGALLSLVWYPPYAFPYENNLAMVDFVETHKLIAGYLESEGLRTVATAWPLTDALRRPEFGYVGRPMNVVETHDFSLANIAAVDPDGVDALVVYSREWRPALPLFRPFLKRFYAYQPQANSAEIAVRLGLHANYRWEHRGMWVEIYRNR